MTSTTASTDHQSYSGDYSIAEISSFSPLPVPSPETCTLLPVLVL